MDVFLRRCREEYSVGRIKNEKEWLKTFYYDVEKCVRQNESDAEFVEICFSALSLIKLLRSGKEASDSSSWIPANQKVTPLDVLTHKTKDIIGGSLVDDVSSGEIISGHGPVSMVPYILVGYLTHSPRTVHPAAPTGTLYLEDNYEAVICELIDPDRECLDKLVFVTGWNYVPAFSTSSAQCAGNSKGNVKIANNRGSKPGYLEVTGKICTVCTAVKAKNPIDECPGSMTVKQYVEDNRMASKINIRGNVFALSPTHSISGGKPFFFVKLLCPEASLATTVVIQGDHFLFWHNFLQINEQYIFINLRETTMNKGTRNERKILATTRHSDYCKYEEGAETLRKGTKRHREDTFCTESKAKQARSEQQDLEQSDHNESLATEQRNRVCESEGRPGALRPRPPTTISYTGVITNCIKPEAGVFELDNKIRLYINHQPSVSLGRGFRVGAHVTAHNVHLCKKGKKLLGLCCCTQSTVRVVKFSSLTSPWKPFSPCESPFALLGQYLTLADYVDLLDVCKQVLEKFSPLYRARQLISYSTSHHGKESNNTKKASVVEMLLTYTKCTASSPNLPARNIYDEFFDHPHTCQPNRASMLKFPWVPTLREFLDAVSQRSSEQPWLNGGSNDVTSAQGNEEWMYQVLTQDCFSCPVVLIGRLQSSPETGQLHLFDQSGEVDCVIATTGEQTARHCCATDCCAEPLEAGNSCTCPYAHFWHLGAMIQINKFEVVLEKFQQKSFAQNDNSQDGNRIYVQFSFDKTEVLIAEDERVDSNVMSKTLAANSRGDNVKMEGKQAENQSNEFTCKIIFIVRNCEVPTLRKVKEEICCPCGVDIKIVGVNSSGKQKASREHSESSTSERTIPCSAKPPNILSEFTLQKKSAALKLTKKNLCWCQFLHHGCLYVITEMVPDEKSSRIFAGGALKPVIEVDSQMLLRKVCWCESCRLKARGDSVDTDLMEALEEVREDFVKNDKLQSVHDVLTDQTCQKGESNSYSRGRRFTTSRPTTTLVSFRGLVSNRDLRQSNTPCQRLPNDHVEVPKFGPVSRVALRDLDLGFCLLENGIMQLRVRDFESPNVISVYLDLRSTKYIYGILPGAIIQFRKFVKKLSRARNMYCTFEACSSIVVESRAVTNLTDVYPNPQSSSVRPHKTMVASTSTAHEGNQKQLPNRYLIELIRSEAQGQFVQTISRVRCRVTAVQKAMVRWKCNRCGELVTKEQCTNGCSSTMGSRFHAEARCVVEDGTGEAQLYVYDELVPTLLSLSGQQWSNLQDLAMRTGELLYQRLWRGGDFGLRPSEWNLSSKEVEAKATLAKHCCSSRIHRFVVVQCKVFRFNNVGFSKAQQGYESRSIRVGSTEHSTLVLPKLLLRAMHVAEARAIEEIRRLLQSQFNQQDTNSS